ncbi:MAG: rhodanese-like domain-containing protein [Paenibacillaceae bacterium]|nr:rhodanese-like domain-containing protein [Paenibacillaceae bacterium]
MEQIDPETFHKRLTNGELREAAIIDVREAEEWSYYHLEGTIHFPMQTIPGRLHELPDGVPLYVLCAHGVRSAMVCDYLRRQGFGNAVNVEGGMAAVAALNGFAYD